MRNPMWIHLKRMTWKTMWLLCFVSLRVDMPTDCTVWWCRDMGEPNVDSFPIYYYAFYCEHCNLTYVELHCRLLAHPGLCHTAWRGHNIGTNTTRTRANRQSRISPTMAKALEKQGQISQGLWYEDKGISNRGYMEDDSTIHLCTLEVEDAAAADGYFNNDYKG